MRTQISHAVAPKRSDETVRSIVRASSTNQTSLPGQVKHARRDNALLAISLRAFVQLLAQRGQRRVWRVLIVFTGTPSCVEIALGVWSLEVAQVEHGALLGREREHELDQGALDLGRSRGERVGPTGSARAPRSRARRGAASRGGCCARGWLRRWPASRAAGRPRAADARARPGRSPARGPPRRARPRRARWRGAGGSSRARGAPRR